MSAAGEASIGRTGRPTSRRKRRARRAPGERGLGDDAEVAAQHRRAPQHGGGEPAAFATASAMTPSSAPWRSSPEISARRKPCSRSVARPNSAPSACAGRPASRGRTARRCRAAASTSATVRLGSAAGGGVRAATPSRPRWALAQLARQVGDADSTSAGEAAQRPGERLGLGAARAVPATARRRRRDPRTARRHRGAPGHRCSATVQHSFAVQGNPPAIRLSEVVGALSSRARHHRGGAARPRAALVPDRHAARAGDRPRRRDPLRPVLRAAAQGRRVLRELRPHGGAVRRRRSRDQALLQAHRLVGEAVRRSCGPCGPWRPAGRCGTARGGSRRSRTRARSRARSCRRAATAARRSRC